MASASDDTPIARFMETTSEFLNEVKSIIMELNSVGLTTVNAQILGIASDLIKGFDNEKLILSFINCNDDWHKVKERNIDFFMTTVPESYKGIPFDVKILTVPIKVYLDLKKAGSYKGLRDEDDWPVSQYDIDLMWKYFISMIRIACNHILFKRQSNPSYASNVDVKAFVEMFKDAI